MAFSIVKSIEWKAGEGTPAKYGVSVNLLCDLTGVSGTTATFSLTGSITVSNHPTNSQNSFAASDFAVLTLGGFDPSNYPFSSGTSYYEATLPALPNAPQSYINAVQAEFRGDTFRPNPNRASLYIKGQGVVQNALNTESTNTYNVNTTFTLQLTGNPSQEVIIWNSSGANSSTDYNWLTRQVWATMLDFDYRPGATWDGSNWQSHNRNGGVCNVWNGSSWKEMRTQEGGSGTDNPPLIYNGSQYVNQKKIGING